MLPQTLGELGSSSFGEQAYRIRTVKDEMRSNLIRKLQKREQIFPGIIGYEETVIPQAVNAILSRHNMILLGLRGQAKGRILWSLVDFLEFRSFPAAKSTTAHSLRSAAGVAIS